MQTNVGATGLPYIFLRVETERCATIIHGEKWSSLCSKTYSSTIVSAKNIHIFDHTREIVQPLILKPFAGCYKISNLCYIESKPLNFTTMKMFPAFLPTMRSVACRIESFQNHITDELKREWHEKVDIIHTRIKFKLYNLGKHSVNHVANFVN